MASGLERAVAGGAEPVTVRKLDVGGALLFEYAGEVIERTKRTLCLRAHWERPALELAYVTFERGDRFTEWFFSDRWYNILEVREARTLLLKGWYCNVTTPASISEHLVESRDLLLDLWVAADGACRVLDEDEFAASPDLDDATRTAALCSLRALRRAAALRAGPFRALRAQGRGAGVRM
jgi:uncharacterized protein